MADIAAATSAGSAGSGSLATLAVSAARSLGGGRQEPQPEAREGDHDREHPVLRPRRFADALVHDERTVVSQREPADVAEHEREDLHVPDAVGPDEVVVDRRGGGAEEVRAVAE